MGWNSYQHKERGVFINLFRKMMKDYIGKCVERLRQNPNADCSDIINLMLREIEVKEISFKRNLLSNFLLTLYDFDYQTCYRNLVKCIALNPHDFPLKESERNKLFAALWFVIAEQYSDGDYSDVLDEIVGKGINGGELPFK